MNTTSMQVESPAGRINGVQKTIIAILAFIVMVLGLFMHRLLQEEVLTPEQFKQRGVFLFEKPRKVKNFSLLNHQGNTFTKAELQGKWHLLFFGFTHCPDVCPTTLATLNHMIKGVEDQGIKDSTGVILVSVDPARDSVAKLSEYMPYFNPEFNGLTGDFLQVLALASNLNAPFRKVLTGEEYTVDHSAYIFLINEYGDYQGFIKPPFDADTLRQNYQEVRRYFAAQ